MHPQDAIQAAVATTPATITDLLRVLPPGELTPISTQQSSQARDEVKKFQQEVLRLRLSGGERRRDDGVGWKIDTYDGPYSLVGHAYPGSELGRIAKDSPVVLVNRYSRELFYGPEMPALASDVLAFSLVYDEIRSQQSKK